MKDGEEEREPVERESPIEREERNQLFKVFLGGIPRTMDEEELYAVFRKYKPTDVMVMREPATKRSRGFAFLIFPTQKDMDHAIADVHNTRINGRLVTVSKARPFEKPRERSQGRGETPDRRRQYRRQDYDDRYTQNRRNHQNSYYHNDRQPFQSDHASRDFYDEGYNSRRGTDYDSYNSYYNRRFDRRSPMERGPHPDDRREWRQPPNASKDGRRPRWRSRERPDYNRSYPEHRRRHHSPDQSPPDHGPIRHRNEGRRNEPYSRGSSDKRMP